MEYIHISLVVSACGCVLSHIQLVVIPCPPAPLSKGFPRQEYWSGLSFSSLEDLLDPEIKPTSLALRTDYLLLCHLGIP